MSDYELELLRLEYHRVELERHRINLDKATFAQTEKKHAAESRQAESNNLVQWAAIGVTLFIFFCNLPESKKAGKAGSTSCSGSVTPAKK